MNATGIILAGGSSSRMGTNKALLKIGQTTVIEKIVEEMRMITNELIIVTNTWEDYRFLGLPLVADIRKGLGPLAGLEAGLITSTNERNMIVACDMPFVSRSLARDLLQYLDGFDAVVPRLGGRLHPLFAAYRKSCLGEVQHSLDHNQLKIRSFYDRIRLKIVDESMNKIEMDAMSLYNMNEPKEYEKAIEYDQIKHLNIESVHDKNKSNGD